MKKEKRYGLFKGIFLLILIAIVLSWLIPNGGFASTGFSGDGSLTRVGLNDLSWLIYYGIYFSIDKIVLLLAIGGLYGVLVKTNAYERIVSGIASKLKFKKVAVVVISVLVAVLTSLLTQSFVVVIFLPFIISIMNRMKLDKMTVIATTFGSMIVGTIGACYGTEGLVYFNQYMTTTSFEPSTTLLVRAGILLIGLVLFNFFTLLHMKKVEKNEEITDMFLVENDEAEKKNKKSCIVPIIVVGILLFVISVLGYVNWSGNFGIEVFNTFHKTLTEIEIGDFAIFKNILGSNIGALGTWDSFSITAIIVLFTVILGLCYRVNVDEFIANYANGLKKMLKPIACVIAAFTLMVVVYMSPYVATILNKLLSLTDGFNLATMTLSALICNILHTDLGYTGYILGQFLTVEYADYIKPVFVIFTSLYGFVQMFIPTSVLLGIGLTSLNVKYKDWLKYIWKFLLGMLICLLVIFILMAVI